MAKGQDILLSTNPYGKFEECIISGTPYPGMCMELVPNTTPIGGRQTFRARSQTAGAKGPVAVLLPDRDGGKTSTTQYASGDRGFLYWPVAGDELNMLLGDVAGTADKVTEGDLFGINNNGKLIANNSYTSTPFAARESLPALTADTLVYCQYQ